MGVPHFLLVSEGYHPNLNPALRKPPLNKILLTAGLRIPLLREGGGPAAGLTEDQLDFVKHVQLDYEHGREVYEIEFYCGGFEYNIDVDAHTGRIVDFDKDFD